MSPRSALTDANVRSQTYYVALTTVTCWHCGAPTRLLALAVPRVHDTLEQDDSGDGAEDGEPARDTWQRADVDAFLFYIDRLPDEVRRRLDELSQNFCVAQSPATHSSYWANHCERCHAMLDDHELHCEPEGAFVPWNEAAAAKIELLEINEPFEASASGYAPEPEFFRCLRGR